MLLVPDKPVDIVLCCEPGNSLLLVLPHASYQVARAAGVKGSIRSACQNVDIEHRANLSVGPGFRRDDTEKTVFPPYSAACGIDLMSVEYLRCTGALSSNGSLRPSSLPISRIAGMTSWPRSRMQVRASSSLTEPSLPQIP